MTTTVQNSAWRAVSPYVQIARPDHWFKNVFMLLGVMLAFFYQPKLFTVSNLPTLVLAVVATCIVCSSNYVINEFLDAPLDRLHPVKKNRPAACGLVNGPAVIALWLTLAVLGVGLAFALSTPLGLTALGLWVMGCIYNIPPVRSKDIPYIDVLSESLNNPLRLLLGWFALVPHTLPPLSLIMAYWMLGAFFMATKRFAEYRRIGDAQVAAAYRKSFLHYDDDRLLVSIMFYVAACALFSGMFIVRYKLELILAVPAIAGLFAHYMNIALRPDSPVQNPEKLASERGFVVYRLVTVMILIALMFSGIPALYGLFNVEPSSFEPLWRIG